MPEFELKPNYPGLLVTALLSLGGGALFSAVLWHSLVSLGPVSPSEEVVFTLLRVLLVSFLLGLLEVFLDAVRVALSGVRHAWRVRMTSAGLHYPLLSARPIPWQAVRSLTVQYGYNGRDIWLELDPSIKLFNPTVLNLLLSLFKLGKVNFLKIASHKFRVDVDAFQHALAGMAPDLGVGHTRT